MTLKQIIIKIDFKYELRSSDNLSVFKGFLRRSQKFEEICHLVLTLLSKWDVSSNFSQKI